MTDIVVSLLDSPLTRPLLTTRWWGEHDTVDMRTAATVDGNSRAMQAEAFDAAEMSFATFLYASQTTGVPLVALPVFTGRRQTQPLMGSAATTKPVAVDDVRGSRVAVPQYWMTSSVWHRTILDGFYGIPAAEMTWVTCADERFDLRPRDVDVRRCADGRSPIELVETGDCLVALMPRPPQGLRPLFADVEHEQRRFATATGLFPIMHLVVVRADLATRRPDLIARLWHSFSDARASTSAAESVPAYGLDANRTTVAAIVDRAVDEGLVPGPVATEHLFVPQDVLDHTGKALQ